MNKKILQNYFLDSIKYYISNFERSTLDKDDLDSYLFKNLYFLTIQLNQSRYTNKDDRIIDYMTTFRRYYFHLCQDMFSNKISKNNMNRPLAIGFFDQEGTRNWKNHKMETLPHIHSIFVFCNDYNIRFESVFERRERYGLENVRSADYTCYSTDGSLEKLVSYASKYLILGDNSSHPSWEILPQDLRTLSTPAITHGL